VPPGHSGLAMVSEGSTVTYFVLGDLLSKNLWVAIATLRQHQLEEHLYPNDKPSEGTGTQIKPKAVRSPKVRRGSCSTMILDELEARS
jgi:hypothetical protein